MEISSLSPTLSLHSFRKKPSISTSSKSYFFAPNHTSTSFNGGRRLALARSRPGVPARKKRFVCTSLFGLGVPELAVIAGVAALVFGPKQIPEIGRSIGKTVKGFQQAAKEFEAEVKKPDEPGSANEAIEAESVSGSSEQKENAGVSRSKESS